MLNRIKEAFKLNDAQWMGFKVGGIAGLALFLIFGASNALVYGGYGAILLAGKIFGAPVEPVILARTVIGVGMLMGLFSSALLFVVLGSLFGAGVGSVGNLMGAKVAAAKDAAEKAALSSQPVLVKAGRIETHKVRLWTKVGAFVGIALFFAFGLIPGALYGGATGILLANRLFEMGEPSGYMVKTLYGVGSVLGALGTVTVFLVVGAVAGTLMGYAYNAGKGKLTSGGTLPNELGEAGVKNK